MKLICAIIRPFKLEEVKQALAEVGVQGMTVSEVKGFGRQKGHSEIYRGSEYTVDFLPKIMIMMAIHDDEAEAVREAIGNAARTGNMGDGMVWSSNLDYLFRIRTGEKYTSQGVELSYNDPSQPYIDRLSDDTTRRDEASASPKHSAMKAHLVKKLSELGYQVEPSVRVKGSLIDFRLHKDGKILLALYHSSPTERELNYLCSVGEKWNEKIIICDGIRQATEVMCAKLDIKYWTIDTLEAMQLEYAKSVQEDVLKATRDRVAPQTTIEFSAPVSGPINLTSGHSSSIASNFSSDANSKELLAIVDELFGLLKTAEAVGIDSADCEIAAEALQSLAQAAKTPEDSTLHKNGKRALVLLKGTAEGLKNLGEIGEQFHKLLKLADPLFVKIIQHFY